MRKLLHHQQRHRQNRILSATSTITNTNTTTAPMTTATTTTTGTAKTMRLHLLLLVLFSCIVNFTCSERDFNFNESQVPLIEPKDEPKHARQNLHPYVAELSRCHYADSEIILSLVLQDHDWNTVNPNKKSKVLSKLAKFFAIPKEFIMLESVGKHEMYIMQKESLRKGTNKCHKQHQLGRASFVLGCGTTYFSMAEPIVNQIGQQTKDGSIDNITGERFGWWVIWHRNVEVRAHRSRRQATEGSGEDEYDVNYDYDDEDEDYKAEAITEIPVIQTQQQQHAHRHHHGDVSETDLSESNFVDTRIGVDEAINSNAVLSTKTETNPSILDKDSTKTNIDQEIVDSVSQLESVISKTIENTKHIKDVMLPTNDVSSPVAAIDMEKDFESTKILEEIRNELANKNVIGVDESSSSTLVSTTIISTSELQPPITTTTSATSSTSSSSSTTTTPKTNYDENLDIVDDLDDLDTDAVYELSQLQNQNRNQNQNQKNQNSIDSASGVVEPAVDVIAEVIESSTLQSTVTKESQNTPTTTTQYNSTSTSKASMQTPSLFDAILLATQLPIDTLSTMVDVTTTTTTTISTSTTITPIPQMPPLQSPDSQNVYDTSSLLSNSNIPYATSLSSSSSSSTPSLLSSSISSTLAPLMSLPSSSSSSSSSPSSSSSSLSSSSSSMFDVTMIPSSTPSSYSAILTTTEQNKQQRNNFTEEIQSKQSFMNANEPYINPIDQTPIAPTIATSSRITTIDETPLVETTQQTTSMAMSTAMASTTIKTATSNNDNDGSNNGLKAKENENHATLSGGSDPLPNVTSLSSPTQSTPASDIVATPSISTHSMATATATATPLSELTTPTSPSTDYVEPHIENTPPIIKTRLPKINVIAGKYFVSPVPDTIFFDNEDLTNLRLEFTDKEGREVKRTSWIQFNPDTREIYGLPVFDTVAKYFYYLRATDSGNETVTETVEIKVQQHRFERSFNHEINITVKINEKSMPSVDWQIKLIKGVAATLGDETTDAIVVREIPQMRQDPNTATFAYFNETFSTSVCPEMELNDVVRRLDANRLTDFVQPTLGIKSITGQLIGTCRKVDMTPTKPPAIIAKNLPPVPRNQVDRVNATVGHLLVFPVPVDTFYDANDNHLTLSLKTKEHKEIGTRHWLQFDSKNEEFYGIPKSADIGTEEYLLVAEDSGGLTATDALVVVVSHAPKREFSVYFKAYLAIRHEQFNAKLQRKFVESISELFGDKGTHYVQIRSVTTHHDSDGTIVNFYNTTLYKTHNRCPEEEIEAARSVYLMSDNTVRDRVKKTLGSDLNLTNVQVIPLGACHPQTEITHREFIPPKNDEPLLKSTFADDYFYTFILPAAIIVIMIIIALIIACCLHRRRRKSGKMELGDEEERKSFRTKGIPVIFQDELDEKPEIGNKSPIILKDEKPPLLPPSYNTSNMNGDNDVDEYVPPPAVVVGGREARGKSPATPSYRKPPPYVSP